MQPTNITQPSYFHKVVDCQWACPAHTPVPEYIRLIAAGRYADAYMVNWKSNVFPGILGRTCDRPCEPACRRGRVEENNGDKPEPVAICRLKRVAADNKSDIKNRMPSIAAPNGKRIACVGAGPASLTVARDLLPLGYQVTVFDGETKAGGFIRSQIPRFRLPESVIDEETNYILEMGVDFRAGQRVESLSGLMAEGYDAVFVGSGAPRGRDLEACGVEDLRADVRVQPDQPQRGQLEDAAYGLLGGAGGERETELLVLVGGGDELVGVRLDADRNPHQHPLPMRPWSRWPRTKAWRASAARPRRRISRRGRRAIPMCARCRMT